MARLRTPTEDDARRLADALAPEIVDLTFEGVDMGKRTDAGRLLFDRAMRNRRSELVALLADMAEQPRDQVDADADLRWTLFRELVKRHRWKHLKPAVLDRVQAVTRERVMARQSGDAVAPGHVN